MPMPEYEPMVNELREEVNQLKRERDEFKDAAYRLESTIELLRTEIAQTAPDDGSCVFCGCIPTLPHDICRTCLEERAPKTREIPIGATICKHGTEPYDCRICFPR